MQREKGLVWSLAALRLLRREEDLECGASRHHDGGFDRSIGRESAGGVVSAAVRCWATTASSIEGDMCTFA